MMNIKNISIEELTRLIVEKFGEDWNPKNVDSNDELIQEFMYRISQGA